MEGKAFNPNKMGAHLENYILSDERYKGLFQLSKSMFDSKSWEGDIGVTQLRVSELSFVQEMCINEDIMGALVVLMIIKISTLHDDFEKYLYAIKEKNFSPSSDKTPFSEEHPAAVLPFVERFNDIMYAEKHVKKLDIFLKKESEIEKKYFYLKNLFAIDA